MGTRVNSTSTLTQSPPSALTALNGRAAAGAVEGSGARGVKGGSGSAGLPEGVGEAGARGPSTEQNETRFPERTRVKLENQEILFISRNPARGLERFPVPQGPPVSFKPV